MEERRADRTEPTSIEELSWSVNRVDCLQYPYISTDYHKWDSSWYLHLLQMYPVYMTIMVSRPVLTPISFSI